MKTATLLQSDMTSWQQTTHLYRLSESVDDVEHVAVCVSTELHAQRGTTIFAATDTGGTRPHPETGRWWVLGRYVDGTSHEEALADIGYSIEPMEAL